MWSLATIVYVTTALTFGSARHLLQIPDPSSNYNVYVRAIPNNSQQNRVIHPPQEYKPPIFAQFPPPGYEPQPQPPQVQIQAPPKASHYQPPLLPVAQSHPQPPSLPPPQNQQVIYIGGQQGVYPPIGAPSPAQKGPPSVASDRKTASKPVQQLIQKAPASEIQFDKGGSAKEKDSKPSEDEYVIYYYYYYDNDTNNNNLSLNFDDIPNLESYDKETPNKTRELTGRQFPPVTVSSSISTAQSVQVVGQPIVDAQAPILNVTSSPKAATAISVSVSVSEGSRPPPVPNVFRYGSDDRPRVPVTPNLVDPLEEPESSSDNATAQVTTPPSTAELQTPLATDAAATLPEDKEPEENDVEEETQTEVTTQDVTTTTETTTTTEPTTTTTKPGRLGGLGQRKRFRGNAIIPSHRSTTTTTQATVSVTSGRRGAFRPTPGNRFRRPNGGITRPTATSSRRVNDNSLSSATTPSSTTKNRFSSAGKRSSTRTPTTKAQSRTSLSRPRPTLKPGPNPLSRTRPRPAFFRPRNKKVEEPETTTSAPETSQTTIPTKSSEETVTAESTKETEEETAVEETDAPTTTTTTTTISSTTTAENRFSGLFRSRPRPNLLANRSRPNPLNRQRT